MEIYNEIFNELLLRDLKFQVNNKCLKQGKLKFYSTKHFYIKFQLEKNNTSRTLELPYPYKIHVSPNLYCLDYSLSAFHPLQDDIQLKIKTISTKNCSKLYNNYLNILFD